MVSGTDGMFHISDVPSGSFRIHAVFATNGLPEWVAETVPVSVDSGQTTRDAEVKAIRGGLLEVAVLGQSDRKPLAQVTVTAYKGDYQSAANSDSNGLALLRLPPGDYQLLASTDSMSQSRASAGVEAGITNTPGRFEIPALPPGRKYGLVVSAPGFGQKTLNDVNASAEAGRMDLDPFELKPANLKLAGQVLDANDKPVAGVSVILNGEGQPNANTRTDREGRFRFDHVCEGTARLQANNQNSFGNISAEGGDTNVVLRLGQTYANNPGATAHKLKGTVKDADGKTAAGAQVAVFSPNQFNGTSWVKTATNGVFSLTLVAPAAGAVRQRAPGGP